MRYGRGDDLKEELLKFFTFENIKIDSSEILSLIPRKFTTCVSEDFKDFYEDVESNYEMINRIFYEIKSICQSKPFLNIPDHPLKG